MALLRVLFAVVLLLATTSCSNVQYVWQQGLGEWAMMNHARPIQEVINDPHTSTAVRERLQWIPDSKKFVESELGVKPTSNYTEYVDLRRPYVVWVLTAAPPFELKSKEWSFPVVGAVPYLGFFNESEALSQETEEKASGMDTSVRGAEAFSTLGWFSDPFLSSMLSAKRSDIVKLIFHETTHSQVYIKGKTDFNEQAATFIGDYGERLWIQKTYGETSPELQAWEDERQDLKKLSQFLREFADELKSDFATTQGEPENQRLIEKEKLFNTFRQKVGATSWRGRGFGGLVKRMRNNANLLEVLTYEDEKDVYEKLYMSCGSDLKRSLNLLRKLAKDYRSDSGKSPQQLLKSWLDDSSTSSSGRRSGQARGGVCFDLNSG